MILVIVLGVVGLWLAGNGHPAGWGLAATAHLLWLPMPWRPADPASPWPWPPWVWSAYATTALVSGMQDYSG